MTNRYSAIKKIPLSNLLYKRNNFSQTTLFKPIITEVDTHTLTLIDSKFSYHNKNFETTIQCIGSLYNQSCLYKNLYYINSQFMILTVNGTILPPYSVRTDAFFLGNIAPNKRTFNTYTDLEKFVRTIIQPKVIPSVTLHFGQPWHHSIGHALFDGLYPAYVALIRFAPRHLHAFRILANLDDCNDCWSEDVYSRFAGLGLIKQSTLNKMSNGRWFMFDELIMGSGTLCQRCNQPHLQLAGGVELNGSRLFRDRMYHQYGLIPTRIRQNSSSEHRTSYDILQAYVIDNKRYTHLDRKEINNYTNTYRNRAFNRTSKLEWPLIYVTYLYYNHVRARNLRSIEITYPSTYQLIDNNFIAQLKILHQMDIHTSGPGTGQMYQTFLSDGSVNINLGGLRSLGQEHTDHSYTSYLEQHMTSGAPYMKGLYYPINERPKSIKKDELVKLIRQAGKIIFEGFKLPVNPRENLAADGQLFIEMCEKDKEFCSLVTRRIPETDFSCIDLWVEDFVHEHRQWSLKGFNDNGRNISCPFNHTLLHELRIKYGIEHE